MKDTGLLRRYAPRNDVGEAMLRNDGGEGGFTLLGRRLVGVHGQGFVLTALRGEDEDSR